MIAAFRANWLVAALLAATVLFSPMPAAAQSTRDQVRVIEQDYSRTHNGRVISDAQLEYYLDRLATDWSMDRVHRDIAATATWRPAQGWTAREVICTSNSNRYAECRVPFQGHAMITQQISNSPCVEGRSWGNKPGAVWVKSGCRARFGIVSDRVGRNRTGDWTRNPRYAVTCVSAGGRRQTCGWDDRYGRPRLIQQISNSACVEGRDWGYTVGGGLWVNSGCRATFGYGDVRYSDYGYRDLVNTTWVRDPNYSVSCSSTNSGRTVCNWDNRYGSPYVVERMSSSACTEGRDWGYDRNGELWVTSGCRARFGYR